MRTSPYWPTARARSDPSTDRSSRTSVRSRPSKLNVRCFPIRRVRAASTSAVNASPARAAGWGRPSDAAEAEDRDRTSVQFRLHSSAHERSKGHQSAMPHADTAYRARQTRLRSRPVSRAGSRRSAGLALVAGLAVWRQPAVGLGRGDLAGQDPVDLIADGHLNPVAFG